MTRGFRLAHIANVAHRHRQHGAVHLGQPVVPDTLVVNWTAGWRNAEAHRAQLERERDRGGGAPHYLVDRLGVALELVPPTDAAWHCKDATLPPVDLVVDEGFAPVAEAPFVERLANLRSVGVALCNKGFLRASDVVLAEARRIAVAQAQHANPSQRLDRWEGYTELALESLCALLGAIKDATPTLRIVVGLEDVRNGYVTGRGRWTAGSMYGPGPAFPWHRVPWEAVGLVPVRYDYERQGWVVR